MTLANFSLVDTYECPGCAYSSAQTYERCPKCGTYTKIRTKARIPIITYHSKKVDEVKGSEEYKKLLSKVR